jgi:alpha-glucosidase
MKFKVLLLLCLTLPFYAALAQSGKTYQVKSPDGKISINITTGAAVNWSVKHEDTEVIMPSAISMTLDNGEVLGKNAVVKKAATFSGNTVINTPIYKRTSVKDNYNQLTISFKGDYGLVFRAYNDGVSYRFTTQKKGEITVVNEEANFNFKDDYKAFYPLQVIIATKINSQLLLSRIMITLAYRP